MSCGVGHRRGSDPELLWLWCKPAAIAPIGPLAWESPYAVDAALGNMKRQKKKKRKKERKWVKMELTRHELWVIYISIFFHISLHERNGLNN